MKHFCALFVAIFFSALAQAQNSYSVYVHGATFYANLSFSCPTYDKGFATVGTSGSFTKVCVTKLDSMGNVQWATQVEHPNFSTIASLTQTSDSGYVVLGSQYFSPFVKIHMFKLDKNGNLVWAKKIVQSSSNGAFALCPSENGGFACAGTGCNGTNFVIRFDSMGNIIWGFQYLGGTGGYGNPFYMIRRKSGNFVVAGINGTAGNYSLMLFETDTSGNLQWFRNYFDTRIFYCYDIEESANDELTVSGWANPADSAVQPVFLLKTNPAGNFQWLKYYTNTKPTINYNHVVLPGDDYILGGATFHSTQYNNEYSCTHVDVNGNATWSMTGGNSTLNHAGFDATTSVHNAGGNGFFTFASGTDHIALQRHDMWGTGFCDADSFMMNTCNILPLLYSPVISRIPLSLQLDTNNCTVNSVALITTMLCSSITTETNDVTDNYVNVFPNPANENIFISGLNTESKNYFRIADMTGRIILNSASSDREVMIDVSSLNPGCYLLCIDQSDGQIVRPVVIR